MTSDDLRRLLRDAPLVASVQASPGSPLADPATIVRLARASVGEGVRLLRLEGIENIRAVRAALPDVPTIGLIKREYPGSDVYITPTLDEVRELLALGCEIVAFDATERPRPDGATVAELIAAIRAGGALAMADVAIWTEAKSALRDGAAIVSTTLSGYVGDIAPPGAEPDLVLVTALAFQYSPEAIVMAEGRYSERRQVMSALQNGADGVVVGGALNDPVKMTRALSPPPATRVAAFDLGGTWLRFLGPDGLTDRTPTPRTRAERLAWVGAHIRASGAERAAVSTGGTVDLATGEVWEAKAMIPEHVGTRFDRETLGVPTVALNDGHCAALAHARRTAFGGRRIATLALGTGVGVGMVADGRLWRGPRGEYPRLNDLPFRGTTVESVLGGLALTADPTAADREAAIAAFLFAVETLRATFMPELIFVCGSVGLSPWLRDAFPADCRPSPYGPDAALYGALSLARWGE